MDLTNWLEYETRDESFDPGVLDVESFLTEEQEAKLLDEYTALVNEEVVEDETADEAF